MRFEFQPLDKAFLAGTRAPWASFAPLWRLEYTGPLELEPLRRALGWVLERYPSCAARVVALDGPFERARRFAWEVPDGVSEPVVEVLDVSGLSPEEAARREQALADRFLDLEREPPFLCTWVKRSDTSGVLALQQHHSLADGRAFLGLVGDLMRALDAALEGESQSPLDAAIVTRRPEREAVSGSGLLDWLRGLLAFAAELCRALLLPLAPLATNAGTDYAGANRTRHLFVPADRLERWRHARARVGLSTNDLLAGALCAALARFSARHGEAPGRHNLFMPLDVRPRAGHFESFANHLSSIQVRWKGGPDARPLELARAIHQASSPLLRARLPFRRVRFDGGLVQATRIDVLRRALLDRRRLLTNYSFSNLIPLGTPGAGEDHRWHFGAATVERLLITTPCTPPQAANTTVVRYGDQLCFNLNYKDSALAPPLAEELAQTLQQCLDEVDAAVSETGRSPAHG